MAGGKNERDISELDNRIRIALLDRVTKDIGEKLRDMFSSEEGFEHFGPLAESHGSSEKMEYRFKVRRGRCWGFDVYASADLYPTAIGENLSVLVQTGSRLEDLLLPIGCLPAAVGTLGLWAYAVVGYQSGDLSSYTSKWIFIAGIFAGLVLLLVSVGILTTFSNAIKLIFIDGPRYATDEQALRDAFDVSQYEVPDLQPEEAFREQTKSVEVPTTPDSKSELQPQQDGPDETTPVAPNRSLNIVTCSSCGTKVMPKADGTCPACQQSIV